jgi:hypothetical protein
MAAMRSSSEPTRPREKNDRAIGFNVVSLVVLACLSLQSVVISRLLWSPRRLAGVYDTHWVPPSAFWPFVDYPMYAEAHHAGEALPAFQVVATTEDGAEVVFRPEDRSIGPRTSGLVIAMIQGNRSRTEHYCEEYRLRYGRRLASLRLEEHRLELTRAGFVAADPGPARGTSAGDSADPR